MKAEIDGFRAISRHLKDTTMLQLVKEVSKKVMHPATQKEVVRKCKISFNAVDPKAEDWIEDALAICGGDSSLAAKVFNQGLWRTTQQWETNKLGKVDEISKGLQRAINGLVQTGMYNADEAKTFLMSNPATVAALGNAKFEQFIETSIDDFAEYCKVANAEGVISSRFPDITDVGEPEADEAEEK
jgi:polyhydroxyalkanoate synthesis regulator phasin